MARHSGLILAVFLGAVLTTVFRLSLLEVVILVGILLAAARGYRALARKRRRLAD